MHLLVTSRKWERDSDLPKSTKTTYEEGRLNIMRVGNEMKRKGKGGLIKSVKREAPMFLEGEGGK